MIVAVNCRLLLKDRLEGIGRFTDEILRRLVRNRPQDTFIFLFDRPFDSGFIYEKNVLPVVVSPPARHPFLYIIWFEWRIPHIIKKYKADIFFSPDGYLSTRINIPQYAVFHDLAFEHFPEGINRVARWHYTTWFPKYASIANKIFAVSDFTKQDIIKTYHVNEKKIYVTHNAASDGFKPLSEYEQLKVREKYSHGSSYFLFTGAIHPRKNLTHLLLAFELFRSQNSIDIKLLITGREGWKNDALYTLYSGLSCKEHIIFTGRVSEDELYKITASGFATCYVSLFEGFGIPILEAMQCGVPVITSNITSMPEVAGDAAILVNPYSPTEICQAMLQLVESKDLYIQLQKKGLERAKKYLWDDAARAVEDGIFEKS